MASQLPPMIINNFMGAIQETALGLDIYKPLGYFVYVDDTFVTWP
jgi:hypothetical protein